MAPSQLIPESAAEGLRATVVSIRLLSLFRKTKAHLTDVYLCSVMLNPSPARERWVVDFWRHPGRIQNVATLIQLDAGGKCDLPPREKHSWRTLNAILSW